MFCCEKEIYCPRSLLLAGSIMVSRFAGHMVNQFNFARLIHAMRQYTNFCNLPTLRKSGTDICVTCLECFSKLLCTSVIFKAGIPITKFCGLILAHFHAFRIHSEPRGGRVSFFKFMRDTTPRTSFICDRSGVSRKKLRQEEVTIFIENIHSISNELSEQRNGCQVSWNGIFQCYPLIGLICLINLGTLLSNKKIISSIDCSIIICWFLKMYSQLQM